jgi:hypothetical protein
LEKSEGENNVEVQRESVGARRSKFSLPAEQQGGATF